MAAWDLPAAARFATPHALAEERCDGIAARLDGLSGVGKRRSPLSKEGARWALLIMS
jgi:hypothetical protein